MNKFLSLAGLIVLTCSHVATANTLIFPSGFEPDLTGNGGILDNEFGLANLQRIDDDLDRYWSVAGGTVTTTTVAKHAGFTEDFGFIDANDNFTSVLYVPSMNGQSNTFSIAASGSSFRFGLDPNGSPLLSSDPLDNQFCGWFKCYGPFDHMVSWLVTGGQYAGDYVVAWEDLKKLGDRDYNDLVIRVTGVTVIPVPGALILFGSGLIGLVAVSKRRR